MVTFKNGTQLETVAVYGGMETFQAAQRKTLEIVVSAELLTLDEAKEIWQDSGATSEMTIESDGQTSVQLDYTLPVSLTLNTLNDTPVVRMKLAQKSALEIEQEKQAQDMDDVNAALCELAELIAGGENDG